MDEEKRRGLWFLEKFLTDTSLKLGKPIPIAGRTSDILPFLNNEGRIIAQIQITDEYLTDLPGTRRHQESSREYIEALAGRARNHSADLYFCRTGVPIKVEIEWPIEYVPQRDMTYVHVVVRDLAHSRSTAGLSMMINSYDFRLGLDRDFFLLERAIVNSIREAVDLRSVEFIEADNPPVNLQGINLDLKPVHSSSSSAIDGFLLGKVLWLGFSQGDASTEVWTCDPWDADYLGVERNEFRRASQILAAKDLIILDKSSEFARPGKSLLAQARSLRDVRDYTPEGGPHTAPSDGPRWDLFICHAGEDKDEFVRPLANALEQQGLKVWFDEINVKLGDSLRRKIDHGLNYSRFGVVVLSLAFFAKEWPQRELDGLAAREIGGGKVILPIWHKVTFEDVRRYSPTLADRRAVSSARGIEVVVKEIVEAISHKS